MWLLNLRLTGQSSRTAWITLKWVKPLLACKGTSRGKNRQKNCERKRNVWQKRYLNQARIGSQHQLCQLRLRFQAQQLKVSAISTRMWKLYRSLSTQSGSIWTQTQQTSWIKFSQRWLVLNRHWELDVAEWAPTRNRLLNRTSTNLFKNKRCRVEMLSWR